MLKLGKFVVAVPTWMIDRKWWVAYLIINDVLRREVQELIDVAPDERFNRLVTQHLDAYVEKGTMPPTDIAPAILNMADDLMAGRQPTIRAGDYIALQSHLRQSR